MIFVRTRKFESLFSALMATSGMLIPSMHSVFLSLKEMKSQKISTLDPLVNKGSLQITNSPIRLRQYSNFS